MRIYVNQFSRDLGIYSHYLLRKYWNNIDLIRAVVNLNCEVHNPGSIYYIAVTVYGISSPQAGTMSAYITFLLPPNTSLAISSGTPMRCYGGETFQEFTCDYSLQQLYPGVNQYAIPSGEYGNVWPIGAGAGWEFLIPVKTSTTLNNSTLWSEITNIDGYQNPPKLYPEVPIYVWEGPAEAPGAFNKFKPVNGATKVEIYPQLSWNESARAASYYYCLDTTNDNTCSNWISETVAVAELSPGTTYYWQIKAVNDNGTTYANGDLAFWSFTTGAPPPAPVLNAIINNDGDGTYIVSWSSSPGAISYNLQEDDNEIFSSPTNVFGGATLKEITGKNVGERYYYRVNASNFFGSGNWSNVVSTLLCPHPGIWKGDTSPAGYGIEFQIQSTPSCQIVAGSLKIILGSPFGTITYPNSYNITSSQISFSGNNLQMTGDFTSFTIADGSFSYTGTPTISGLWDANYSP